jgi:transcriptional regulator with XRE-family HTH domain
VGIQGNDDVQAFAARLSELKRRSGRSFEALAKRAQLSRSALHRYCTGRAVPAEYLTVDRLARHCAADRAELLELHRLWVLADAARRQALPGRATPARTCRPAPHVGVRRDPATRRPGHGPGGQTSWAGLRAAAFATAATATALGLVKLRREWMRASGW